MHKPSRFAASLALAAILSTAASPALARDRDWDGYRHHRDRIDGGDVLAGILIIGGIAAIASAASKAKKEAKNYPDEPPITRDNGDYAEDARPEWQGSGSSFDAAVNRCVDEVSRGSTQVEEVDSVNREGDGWRVAGQIAKGGQFTCTIDRDGRIRTIEIDALAD